VFFRIGVSRHHIAVMQSLMQCSLCCQEPLVKGGLGIMFFKQNPAWMKEFSNLGLYSDSTQTTWVKLCVIAFRISLAISKRLLLAPAFFAIFVSCKLWLGVWKSVRLDFGKWWVFNRFLCMIDGSYISKRKNDDYQSPQYVRTVSKREAIKYRTCATCRNVA